MKVVTLKEIYLYKINNADLNPNYVMIHKIH